MEIIFGFVIFFKQLLCIKLLHPSCRLIYTIIQSFNNIMKYLNSNINNKLLRVPSSVHIEDDSGAQGSHSAGTASVDWVNVDRSTESKGPHVIDSRCSLLSLNYL